MKLKIIPNGNLKDYFSEQFLEVPEGCNSILLKEILKEKFPESNQTLSHTLFAKNSFVLTESETLSQNDTIYLIPPVSGG
ncbi:MAG: MoaD/ThiS family protein [Leptospiraceae bacterium]|nr:MoaD/ThiS family protein [Leptospiraceae bacterium]